MKRALLAIVVALSVLIGAYAPKVEAGSVSGCTVVAVAPNWSSSIPYEGHPSSIYSTSSFSCPYDGQFTFTVTLYHDISLYPDSNLGSASQTFFDPRGTVTARDGCVVGSGVYYAKATLHDDITGSSKSSTSTHVTRSASC